MRILILLFLPVAACASCAAPSAMERSPEVRYLITIIRRESTVSSVFRL